MAGDRIYDCNAAVSRCQRMWRKLGGLLEKEAYAAAERRDADGALKFARIADVCLWHATGEFDTISMKDVAPSPAALQASEAGR